MLFLLSGETTTVFLSPGTRDTSAAPVDHVAASTNEIVAGPTNPWRARVKIAELLTTHLRFICPSEIRAGNSATTAALSAYLASQSGTRENGALVIDAVEEPGGAVVYQPADGAVGQLHIPLVARPRAAGPPLARGAPWPRAGHDPPRQRRRAEMDRAARGERHMGGAWRAQPAQRQRRRIFSPTLTPALSPRGGEGFRFPLPSRERVRVRVKKRVEPHGIGTVAVEQRGNAELTGADEGGQTRQGGGDQTRAGARTPGEGVLGRRDPLRVGFERHRFHHALRGPGLERDPEQRRDGRRLAHGSGQRERALVQAAAGQAADPFEAVGREPAPDEPRADLLREIGQEHGDRLEC